MLLVCLVGEGHGGECRMEGVRFDQIPTHPRHFIPCCERDAKDHCAICPNGEREGRFRTLEVTSDTMQGTPGASALTSRQKWKEGTNRSHTRCSRPIGMIGLIIS